MEKEVQLPLVTPPFQTIPSFTDVLAILYAHSPEKAERWICNNCCSVRFQYFPQLGYNTQPYLQLIPVFALPNCSLLECFRIPYHSLKSDLLLSAIKQYIDQEYYVVATVDGFHVPAHEDVFMKTHLAHPLLINGYTSTSFWGADHFLSLQNNHKFTLKSVLFNDFIAGVDSAHSPQHIHMNYFPDYWLIKYKEKDEQYKLCLPLIASNLKAHLLSEPCKQYPYWLDNERKKGEASVPYGIAALYAMLSYLEQRDYQNWNLRLLHENYVHSQIIWHITKKFEYSTLQDSAKQNMQSMLVVRNMLMKYCVDKKERKRLSIELLRNAIKEEQRLCTQLYNYIANENHFDSSNCIEKIYRGDIL